MSDHIIVPALHRRASDHTRALAAIGESTETGTQLERVEDRVVKAASADTKHYNYHLVIGGPSVYVQHHVMGSRWVIIAAWREELYAHQLDPERSDRHRLAILALETAT